MQALIHKFAILLFLSSALVSGCASTSNQESTGQYIDNSVVTAKVKAAIADDATLHVAQINVETYKGVVQLSGFADTQADINRASALARSVQGVQSVKNDMQLK